MSTIIQAAKVYRLEAPVEAVVRTSFGVMNKRTALLLSLRDRDGLVGWGESWVNFPAWAAAERQLAFEQAYLPYLKGRQIDDIPSFITEMAHAFIGPARQAAATGPLVQALCAVEVALWDLQAQRAGKSLAQFLFRKPAASVRVYASGINSPLPWARIDQHLQLGVRLFKLKLGFGRRQDRTNLRDLKRHLGSAAGIAVDVNRGWTVAEARKWLSELKDLDIAWLEEPLVTEQESQLGSLRRRGVPIAAGENAESPVSTGADILQPDITKNFGLHRAVELLGQLRCGQRLYPHFLGSAVGQAASFHLAAGCGKETWQEWDINANSLRTDLTNQPFEIRDGRVAIPNTPGLGWQVVGKRLAKFRAG
ncbi:MAG: mandelate racemase/muconate lactonizing enzyme family protein [Verrucomicrobiota bacterium]